MDPKRETFNEQYQRNFKTTTVLTSKDLKATREFYASFFPIFPKRIGYSQQICCN